MERSVHGVEGRGMICNRDMENSRQSDMSVR